MTQKAGFWQCEISQLKFGNFTDFRRLSKLDSHWWQVGRRPKQQKGFSYWAIATVDDVNSKIHSFNYKGVNIMLETMDLASDYIFKYGQESLLSKFAF